jgi:nucleoside-diphosphate-sugar epimerase
VRTKYHFQKKLRTLALYDRTITLYLTSLIGGNDTIPHSHVVEGIPKVIKYINFARFLHADASFHFIHAADAGRITAYLLDSSIRSGEIVLGNAPVAITQAIDALAQARGKTAPFHILLSAGFLRGLAKLLKVKMDPWTEYHLNRRHFTFNVKDAASFGLSSRYKNLDDLIRYFRELNLI